MKRLALFSLAACFSSAGAATSPPGRPTEWPATWVEGPTFYCANGIGVALQRGEGYQRPTYQEGNAIVEAMGGLGPLTRIRLAHVVAEVQWPALATPHDSHDPSPVYANTYMELFATGQAMWGVAMGPRRENQPEPPSVDTTRKTLVIRFPTGAHSGEVLDLARRFEYVQPADRRCAGGN